MKIIYQSSTGGATHVSFDNEGTIGINLASHAMCRNVSCGQQRWAPKESRKAWDVGCARTTPENDP